MGLMHIVDHAERVIGAASCDELRAQSARNRAACFVVGGFDSVHVDIFEVNFKVVVGEGKTRCKVECEMKLKGSADLRPLSDQVHGIELKLVTLVVKPLPNVLH